MEKYFNEKLHMKVKFANIYKSVDEFRNSIKILKGFRYTQVSNLFAGQNELFSQVGSMWGKDLPSKLQIKISYFDLPMKGKGDAILDKLHRNRSALTDVVVIGCDDTGIEAAYDFNSIITHIDIKVDKDENDYYSEGEIQDQLIKKLENLREPDV
jgi:hypothetical protein